MLAFFRPDIEKLRRKEDTVGLMKALRYKCRNRHRMQQVHEEAVEALGTFRSSGVVDFLKTILEGYLEAGAVREKAAAALGTIGDVSAVGALATVLEEARDQPRLRVAIAKALGQIEDAGTVTPLIGALRDREPSVREMALAGLYGKRDPRVVEPLGAALRDPRLSGHHWLIVEALREIGGAEAERILHERQAEERQQAEEEERMTGLRPEIDRLRHELIDIGRAGGFLAASPSRTSRVRQIGERLNEIGGIELMRSVGSGVAGAFGLGSGAGRELEAAWDGIGSWHG